MSLAHWCAISIPTGYIRNLWQTSREELSHKKGLFRLCILLPVNNTSVCKYWKILFYTPNTDAGTFYGGSTDIDTDAQYPKFNTDILVFPVFYSISISNFQLVTLH